MRSLIIAAALCGLALTIAGAAGAHVIGAGDPAWNSAIQFGFVHTLAAVGACALPLTGRLRLVASWVFLLGVLLFAFGLIARAVAQYASGGDPLGGLILVVPVGGTAFMVGWVLLAVAAWRQPKA